MKRLNHPNVIKYFAIYIDLKKHQGWLVMEYIDFPSLEKAKVKSEEDLQNIMFQLMEALSYLHR
jgi:serine/threonine protein kinase